MKEVTIITEIGGIGLGEIDEEGRLIYRSGIWIPSRDPDILDRILRKNIARIVEDGGKRYKEEISKLAFPPTYKEEKKEGRGV